MQLMTDHDQKKANDRMCGELDGNFTAASGMDFLW